MLLVTVLAADPRLMDVEQMRLAAGLQATDNSRDVELNLLNLRVSADITDACRVAIANGGEPTLKQETLSQVCRGGLRGPLILARRHNVEIVSAVADGTTLAADQYEVEGEAGLLWRLCDGAQVSWTERKIVVTYKAGFAEVPAALVGAASDLVRLRLSELSRDPLVKSQRVEVDGVETVETGFWVNAGGSSSSSGPVPADILAKLSRFTNSAIR